MKKTVLIKAKFMNLAFINVAFILLSITILSGTGKKAPGFALMNNNGKFVYKSKLKGNLLISFWASHCVPCRKEMPALANFEKKYKKTKDLTLILINTDTNDSSGDAKKKAEDTLREIKIKHNFLLDQYHMVLKKYNPKKSVPATFLVNKKGEIIFQEIGTYKDTLVRLEKAIQAL